MQFYEIFIAIIYIIVVLVSDTGSKDPFGMQPRLFVEKGHLIFQSALNHNITFRSAGFGGIHINDDDILHVVRMAKTAVADLQVLQTSNVGTLRQTIQQLQDDVSTLMAVKNQVEQLEQTVTTLANRVNDVLGPQTSTISPPRSYRRLFTRLQILERKVRTIATNLGRNECLSNPCQHGGTCRDRYKGFDCVCPSNWEGSRCDIDVNECLQFVGTDLGCQNGGTCRNSPGGYGCQCTANWYGVHCTEQHDDCSAASQEALCGHGTCINVQRALAGQPKYRCICDQGWVKNSQSPACDVDFDECNSSNPPCSKNPPVTCINLPGTFHCGSCPSGYTGNGFSCTDINECDDNNGGCSLAPRVDCVNTPGSRICGSCPLGYIGNGVICSFSGACANNNGGCHPLATCIENTAISVNYKECRCPNGYIGNGMGSNGCVEQSGSTCNVANPCVHGRCRMTGSTVVCDCFAGYSGALCNVAANRCIPNPCKNGGTCSGQGGDIICSCSSDWQGPTCEIAKESCGGTIRDPLGTIRFPSVPGQQYPHDTNCAWRIITTPGKVISVIFKEINVEVTPDCASDFLALYDGQTAHDHIIGHYCGNSVPSPFNTTHNMLYVWFRSDKSVSGNGFEMEWNTTDPVCGGKLPEVEYGTINSPGYPGIYANNRDCYWIVEVALGKRIQFHFATLMIEVHPNCSYDFLQIRDGIREVDPVLATYCTVVTPAPLQTSGPYAWVHFHSDEYATGNGFYITYSAVPGIPGCGGILTAERGAITSPNFPDPYENRLECDWVIRIHPEDRIQLTFTEFQLERHRDCRFDFIEVRDGDNGDAPLLGRFCGGVAPRSILSSKNFMWIKFRADASITGRGFRAQYITACGGVYSELEGTIKSPYFPDHYPESRTCNYVIQVPLGNLVHLNFLNFTIESSEECRYDYLEVRDGGIQNGTVLGHLCGSALPAPITSTYNIMILKFASDGTVQNTGFLANYSSLPIGCGGVMTEDRGVFGSPSNPNYYPASLNCTWLIRAPAGSVIRLTFTSFILEDHVNCNFDFVELRDSRDQLLRRFCGSRIPPIITSAENELLVLFQSDDSIAREGFTASYDFLNDSTGCGSTYLGQMGVIKSPQYPRNYPSNRDCTWLIHADNGQQILLNITDFNLEHNRNCDYDYLEIRNGGYPSSPLVGKYCGTNIPNEIKSHSNQMYLHFHSDQSNGGHGFLISYDGTSTGCGGEITSTSGSITSPNYPLIYNHNAECTWIIRVAQSSEIFLTVVDIDIEGHSECLFDVLEVYDGENTKSKKMMHLCNSRQNPGPMRSTGNVVLIKFRSDLSLNGRGFHLSYHALCNTNLTIPHGVIESPNFPSMYPYNFNCTWTIVMPVGNNISLAFSHLVLEDEASCQHDYVEIIQGKTRNSPQQTVTKFCGTPSPSPVLNVTSNIVIVKFVSDGSLSHDGFRLEYAVRGCGGVIKKEHGTITSPNYPNHYPANIGCEWHIIVPDGNSISLTIGNMDVETSSNCGFDHLKIYGGLDHDAPILFYSCHKTTSSQIITSSGNHMLVQFKSDDSYTGQGFYLSWYSRRGCGGYISTASGSITSPHFPSPYDLNDDCLWRINTDINHVLQLSFVEFDLSETENCTDSFVSVTEEYYSKPYLLPKYCGTTNPPVITSPSNAMTLRFKGSNQTATKGFQANYVSVCGGELTVAGREQLVSSNYPHPSVTNDNCTWILSTRNPQDHVTLTITHMMILSYDNCTETYLEIRDGSTSDSPIIGRYCGYRLPPALTSQGNALHVFLQSQGVFRAVYSSSTSVCGGDLTAKEGVFHSPNYPNSYEVSTDCVWTIKASPGNLVQMSISMFSLEESEYCNKDYLEIRENNGMGPLIGRFCGSNFPSNTTIANQLWIKFHSDEEGVGQGFTADYVPVTHVDLTGMTGVITSPWYTSNQYIQDTFTWTITVPVIYYISITFNQFSIQSGGDVCYNYLDIYDGPDENALLLDKLCGVQIPQPVISHSNQLFLKFHSRYGFNKWHLSWTAVNDSFLPTLAPNTTSGISCGEDFFINTTASVQITSPGYPLNYDSGLNCTWIVQSNFQRHIVLTFDVVDTEGTNETCHFDYISIYDMEPPRSYNWVKKDIICGSITEKYTVPATSSIRMITFQSDHSYSRSGFSLNVSEDCGNVLTNERGILQSSDAIKRYGFDSCEWLIKVRPGRTIKITFQEMNIPSDGVCYTQYLLLRNGGHSTSPYLGEGKYCGQQLPDVPESNSNQVYITLKRVALHGQDQEETPIFKLLYEEVSLGCDHNFYLTSSSPSVDLQSPNYPSAPQHSVECNWVIMSPSGTVLRIDFDKLLFNNTYCWDHANVNGGYVGIYDGGTVNSPFLATRCNTLYATSLHSTGNVMLVRFVTSEDYVNSVFKGSVHIHKCGGRRTYYEEPITSPNFPNNYDNNVECEWIIDAVHGVTIKAIFDEFELPPSNSSSGNCTDTDYVEIREERSTGSLLGVFCGTVNKTFEIFSPGNMYIKFKSDSSDTLKGFKLRTMQNYQDCGGYYQTPSGSISSPDYPNSYRYRHPVYCSYAIRVASDRRVSVTFTALNLPKDIVTGACLVDLHVSYGLQVIHTSEDIRLCNEEAPYTLESPTGTMRIYFYIKKALAEGEGFQAVYNSDQDLYCGGQLDTAGTLSSPAVQTRNSTAVECRYSFNSNTWYLPNRTFVFHLTDAKFGSDVYCYKAALVIEAGREEYSRICQNQTNIVYTYPLKNILIQFGTVDSFKYGFNASYQIQDCGGIVLVPSVISSPGFPSNYQDNLWCHWLVTTRYGKQIVVNFTEFELDGNCDTDYILLKNGQTFDSPVIEKICSGSSRKVFQSENNKLVIIFHSDGRGTAKGFNLTVTPVQQGCGGIFQTRQSGITSPNYPNPYPNNVECEWFIKVDEGYHVNLTFVSRNDIEMQGDCGNDYLLIEEKVQNGWSQLSKLCGSQFPSYLVSISNEVHIIFHSNDKITGEGFSLAYRKACGGNLTDDEGTVYSPGYPNFYPYDINCEFLIHKAEGNYVLLKFNDELFDIENSTNCLADYVAVYQGNSTNNPLITQSCGNTAPTQPYVTLGPMLVVFHSDYGVSGKGFSAHYIISNCGGELKGLNGTFSSPLHPGEYVSMMRCTWVITVPEVFAVSLKFLAFELETSDSCSFDYLEMFNGENTSSPLIGRICGKKIPPIIKSSGNQMTVLFYSDDIVHEKGFKAVYRAVYAENAGCGGTIRDPSGDIESLDIDNDKHYEPHLDCVWRIITDVNKVLKLSFRAMDIEEAPLNINTSRCAYDFLEIRDGFSGSDALIDRYCGQGLPDPVTTASNKLYLYFHTDDSINGAGFRISYTSEDKICGGIMTVGNNSQILSSPGFPTTFPPGLHCHWNFLLNGSSNSQEQVSIIFSDFDIPCGKGYLEVSDEKQKFLHRLCGSQVPHEIRSKEGLNMYLASEPESSVRGFSLAYQVANCSRNYTSGNGVIVSPAYPSFFSPQKECEMRILASPGYTISIYFFDFELPGRSYTQGCDGSKLEVYDGTNSSSALLGSWCGYSVPEPIFSSAENVYIHYVVPDEYGRFRILYTTTNEGPGCGGNLVSPEGMFTSPFYPNAYNETKECRWIISIPGSHTMTLTFHSIYLSSSVGCESNYVEVFEGADEDIIGSKSARYCGEDQYGDYISRGSTLLVKLVTNSNNTGQGFRVFYRTNSIAEENVQGILTYTPPPDTSTNVLDLS